MSSQSNSERIDLQLDTAETVYLIENLSMMDSDEQNPTSSDNREDNQSTSNSAAAPTNAVAVLER